MIIKEIEAKSILTKSKLPASEYCINPYSGCAHGCVYCYACFMRRFSGHTEPWGQYVDIKCNANELMRNRLTSMRNLSGTALIGSVTDAYQPLEKKYKLTRQLLKTLQTVDFSVSILTKSDLVVRDIDILKHFTDCSVGLTIATMDDKIRKRLEPGAVSINRRVKALEKLYENGIKTYVFIGPVFPEFTDIKSILNSVKNFTHEVWGESLNIKGGNWSNISNFLSQYYPHLFAGFKTRIQDQAYWDRVEDTFNKLCNNFNIPFVGFFRH